MKVNIFTAQHIQPWKKLRDRSVFVNKYSFLNTGLIVVLLAGGCAEQQVPSKFNMSKPAVDSEAGDTGTDEKPAR